MKITFNIDNIQMWNADLHSTSFEIQGISWIEEDGRYFDICVSGTEEVLLEIAKLSKIGWNIVSIEEHLWKEESIRASTLGATHEALYAQLPPFRIEGNNRTQIIPLK